MKLSSMMLAAVVMVGSFGAMGCNKAADQGDDQGDDTASGAESSFFWGHFGGRRDTVVVRFAPPAARYENPGAPPSNRHFWVNGYHRWNGREYVWVGGHWDVRRDGSTWVQPHYDYVDGQWRFMRGHWA